MPTSIDISLSLLRSSRARARARARALIMIVYIYLSTTIINQSIKSISYIFHVREKKTSLISFLSSP